MSEHPGELRVRYNPWMGGAFLALALFQVVVGLMIGKGLTIGLGAFFVVIATLYLSQPYFVLAGGAVQLRNLLGMTMKTIDLDELDDLMVEEEGRRITYAGPGGVRRRVKLTRWLARRGDWERFVVAVGAGAFD